MFFAKEGLQQVGNVVFFFACQLQCRAILTFVLRLKLTNSTSSFGSVLCDLHAFFGTLQSSRRPSSQYYFISYSTQFGFNNVSFRIAIFIQRLSCFGFGINVLKQLFEKSTANIKIWYFAQFTTKGNDMGPRQLFN